MAAAAVGLSTVSAYRRRQRWPRFAAAWGSAAQRLAAGRPAVDRKRALLLRGTIAATGQSGADHQHRPGDRGDARERVRQAAAREAAFLTFT
jgi:hypothetical protein